MQVQVKINGTQLQPTTFQLALQAADALLRPSQHDLTIPMRERIEKFEYYAKQLPRVEFPVEETLQNGCYKRKVVFPKGFVGSGKIHVIPHMDVMTRGKMLLATEDGVKLVEAPYESITEPFTRKFGIALEETEWISFNSTTAQTTEEAAKEMVADSWDDVELMADFEERPHVCNSSRIDCRGSRNRLLVLPS